MRHPLQQTPIFFAPVYQKRVKTCIRFGDFEVLHDYFEVTLK